MELQVMDRARILDLMGELKLFGMRAAFDEVMTSALKRGTIRNLVCGAG